jgi:hypothetical protein
MKISSVASVVFLAISVPVILAQESANDLPSAPSAVKQGQSQPQQTTPPADAKPADTTPPAAPSASDPTQNSTAASDSILEQPKETPNPDLAGSISVRVNEVNVVFTVTDKRGRLIKDLNREDFRVVDDGRPDTRVTFFKKKRTCLCE